MSGTAVVIDRERIAELSQALTALPSPTGDERPLAEWIVARLKSQGIEAEVQGFAAGRANVAARRAGEGGGPSVLLYSAIDTARPLEREAEAGGPGVGSNPPLLPGSKRIGDWIVGPGAENPKGFATAALGAFEAVCNADIELSGEVRLALTAGGMPAPPMSDRPERDGLGRGCREYLDRYGLPDVALIAKPGDAVSVEEVGVALFRIRVSGDLGYTGIRHRAPLRHAIRDAAVLVERLEAWFPTYTALRTTATMSPQGAVTAIAGGWPDGPVFLPASCDVWVDLRVLPGESIENVQAVLADAVAVAMGDLDGDATVALLGNTPGAATPRDAWIVQAAIRAWEARTGRQHLEASGTSGVTDASVLRGYGIPTARVGMPRPRTDPPYPGFSMGQVNIDSICTLTETLVNIVVDAVNHDRAEVVGGNDQQEDA